MPLKFVRSETVSSDELERFRLDEEDAQWLAERAQEFEQQYRGKYIAVVNKQIFVGESFEEAHALARRACPEREPIVEHVPLKRRLLVV
jgi:hypothetical protein